MTDLLDNALEDLKTHLLESPEYVSKSDNKQRWYDGNLKSNETSRNLRLDWELAKDQQVFDSKKILDLMMQQCKNDLADIIENGDEDNREDALLKSFDGSKKRGKKPVEIEIIAAHLIEELKENKGVVEFTLFLRPYVRWEE